MSNFGETLAGLIIEKNLTSKELAKDLSVTVQCLNRWKTNKTDIGLSHLAALCRYFGCSLDYLIGKTEHDSRPSKFNIDNFGKQVRRVMKEKNVSTYKLQNETKYSGVYFNSWDNGSDPKLSTLIELAKYFECSLDELVGFE